MAEVKCCVCGKTLNTSWAASGEAGFCRHCNIWWYSRCQATGQCPKCGKYTK